MLDEVVPQLEQTDDVALLIEEIHSEELDFSTFRLDDFEKSLDKIIKSDDLLKSYSALKKAKPYVENLFEEEKQTALDKFTSDGSSADDFEFHSKPFFEKFEKSYQKAKSLYSSAQKENIQKRDHNYQIKNTLLVQMRLLADGTAGKNAFDKFKAFQLEWKNTGPVPSEKSNELWSSYHAVCNRFYDNRSITFELLDLDRKRNLVGKTLICEKVEALAKEQSIKKMLLQLDELHEEFKHIGPVPKEAQEEIWNRLKLASDQVHEKKRAYLELLKSSQEQNFKLKSQLLEKIKSASNFSADLPAGWAAQTKVIDDLQAEWKSLGFVSKEKSKEINAIYWEVIKQFYHSKREFFKVLDVEKVENLKKKVALCEQVEALLLSDSSDNINLAIQLQKDWKEIGHVPIKQKDKIYDRFKKACDAVFESKRNAQKAIQEEAKLQLIAKSAYVENLEKDIASKITSKADIDQLISEWSLLPESLGAEYGKIATKFADLIKLKLNEVTDLTELKKEELVAKLHLSALKHHPDGEKELQNRERKLRKDIRDIEDVVAQYKNNMEFFTRAKNADAIKLDFNQKIEAENAKLALLKVRLNVLINK